MMAFSFRLGFTALGLLALATALYGRAAPGSVTLLAAGDIADCQISGDEQTAKLIDQLLETRPDATVAALGDLVYPSGSLERYQQCYGPNWGRFLTRTRPAIGNHDVQADGGKGYYAYFGARAGKLGQGYYSYELGAWHVVVLNSNCGLLGCGTDAAQIRWLEADLKAHPAACTLAYWHHPRYSSGPHGSSLAVKPFFAALYAAGADVVLSGHDHLYERFAPMDADAGLDAAQGIRQFVVGTGGESHYHLRREQSGSQVRLENMDGILQLTLKSGGYDWRFVNTAGAEKDAGSASCH